MNFDEPWRQHEYEAPDDHPDQPDLQCTLVAVLNGANSDSFYGIIPGDVPMIFTLNGDNAVAARQQYFPSSGRR